MIIDPHVHLRDWEQQEKETISHGLETAFLCGISGLFDMPNCSPTLTSGAALQRRLEDAEAARRNFTRIHATEAPFYAVYAGITAEPAQLEEIVDIHRHLFPRVIGLKLFAGRSTGPLAVVKAEGQRLVWKTLAQLDYRGIVAVHCEKEQLMQPTLWDPARPESHSSARPPEAEAASVKDQIAFAQEAGFAGNLHICHISTAAAIEQVRSFKAAEPGKAGFTLSCGATPHHLLMDSGMISEGPEGLLLKVNPPLRGAEDRQALVVALLDGTVDWIESDHAPHRPRDKYRGYASGIPSLVAWPLLINYLQGQKISEERLKAVCGGAVLDRFGMDPQMLPQTAKPSPQLQHSSESRTAQTFLKRYEANGWQLLPQD
ncbi:MAG: dihydroorotase [Spirochaetaceae bacterium]|nr:dihydroorotase [Spirochaetaceae bacterium]MCF7939590.1 dihydroorotase [Spirochaetales bacterium]